MPRFENCTICIKNDAYRAEIKMAFCDGLLGVLLGSLFCGSSRELRAMFEANHSEKLQIVAKIRSKRGYDVDMLGAMGYNITTRKCNFLRFSVVR